MRLHFDPIVAQHDSRSGRVLAVNCDERLVNVQRRLERDVEFYAHILPRGHYAAGKWNDYANADTVLAEQFPLYGVAEVSPTSIMKLELSASSNRAEAQRAASPITAQTTGPQLHAFSAIELCWASEANKTYRVQWTSSLEQPQWVDLEPLVIGTGTNVSIFDSTREHPQGFYRVQIVE